jgi:hypothetical protein
MDYLLLYLVLRLDCISTVGILFAWVTGILFVVTLGMFILNPEDHNIKDNARPWIKRFGIPFAIVLFFAVMMPGTKQAAVIYCLPKVVNNNQVQKMPDNLLRLANKWIDEQLDETVETVTETVAETVENRS